MSVITSTPSVPLTGFPLSTRHIWLSIEHGTTRLPAVLDMPEHPVGLLVFAEGFGGTTVGPRSEWTAAHLVRAGVAVLRVEIIDADEAFDARRVYDVRTLTERLAAAVHHARHRTETEGLPVALYGAGTGSAAAMLLAARADERIAAVVCRGGRPDLADAALAAVRAPVLMIAGIRDRGVVPVLRETRSRLGARSDLILLPRADRAFDEEHEIALAARVVGDWLVPRLQHPRT
ncbi:MAG TPA: dienelactone hydrolase family protein [Actinospica sp.]|jgi:putative phosphoribosyl transferase|nr:dienelactone hydrolase family protein [Actinospica sp.]